MRHRRACGLAVLLAVATSCAGGARPELVALDTTATATPNSQPSPAAMTAETTAEAPTVARAPNGRTFPVVANEPAALAADLLTTETALRDPTTPARELADLGHRQQMLYAALATHRRWDVAVIGALPDQLHADVADHLRARRALLGLHRKYEPATSVPAWEIITPAPATDLLAFYREAEAATGIEWQYLAAINVIETGMGRIVGLSTAGARGPMQFLETTWNEAGIGEGDIDDPHDAIAAAARYLVRRGGPELMDQALFGYNNDERYVRAVSAYADLLRRDEANFVGLYNWEIHFSGATGDLWLPVGYRRENPQPIAAYESEAPWSVPPTRDAD